jgi:hypothetical protein
MQKIDLGQVITVLANIGVIAGIAFLALELRQANQIAIASAEMDIRDNFSSLNESFYSDNDLAELLVKAGDPNAEFSRIEEFKILRILRRLMNVYFAMEVAYENGLIPADTFSSIEDDSRNFASEFPATLPLWRSIVDTYPSYESREFIEVWRRLLEERGY